MLAPVSLHLRLAVTCLGCGRVRVVRRVPATNLDVPPCPACEYVGWREARREDVRGVEGGPALPSVVAARSSAPGRAHSTAAVLDG